MASGSDILLNDPGVFIWENCKSFLNHVLQRKFGCVATAIGVAFEGNQAVTQMKTPALVLEKRFEVLLSRVTVSVHKADLTNFPVDAVVNAANERLQHVGGIALALSKAGGSQIQQDSDEYIRKNGVLRTGEAVAMDAGSLPCKKIIHTVGPHVTGHSLTASAANLLEKAVLNSLKKADECRLRSVALPAISSGIFGYPLKECADTIVKAVRDFCEKYQIMSLKDILLVDKNDLTVNEMERACRTCFSTNPASRSAGRDRKNARTDQNSYTIQLRTVCLTLKWGRIDEEQTNVIVNTTQKDSWDGQISTAILKKAGTKMLKALKCANVGNRNVIVTEPYNLRCAEVYHTLFTAGSTDKAYQILTDAVSECLQLAANHSRQSIAFPAIGTGGRGLEKEKVASIMSEAVFKFANQSSKQMEVYFVIYPGDHSTFQAFKEKMRSLQQKTNRRTNAVTEQRDDFTGSGASTAKISLSGTSEESMREAHVWLTDILCNPSPTRVVQNNFITHFGEEEYKQLTNIMQKNISIEEFLKQGQASVVLTGNPLEVSVAFLKVENMLCKIQENFVEEEVKMLTGFTNQILSYGRYQEDPKAHWSRTDYLNSGLEIVKVERVGNPTLRMFFELKKRQLNCPTTRRMLQRIPGHFCEMVSCIGFQAEFAPPDEPAHGQGIYFTDTVPEAMDMWRQTFSEYLYFVEAEVLTGKSAPGKPDLILPPCVSADSRVRYDSVSGGHGISVIFTGFQAFPVYVITCKKNRTIMLSEHSKERACRGKK